MPKLGLILAAELGGTQVQIDNNFTRLENVFDNILDVHVGAVSVTGTANIQTGLSTVAGAGAWVLSAPSAAACYVTAAILSSGIITLTVYSSTFVVSIVACAVQWVAFGELVLG